MKWSVEPVTEARNTIVQRIVAIAATKHSILLLVSGGSAISIEANVLSQLKEIPQIIGVLPMDERFGPQGHANSNIALLSEQLPKPFTKLYDVLEPNVGFDLTVEHYSKLTQTLVARADYIIAFFGIGADGHTAGILPGSPAATDTISTVIGYNWQDYERMTLGTSALLQVDTAFVLAYGGGKEVALKRLHTNSEPFEKLPAKLLYDIADVTIYNDFINSEE